MLAIAVYGGLIACYYCCTALLDGSLAAPYKSRIVLYCIVLAVFFILVEIDIALVI